MRHLLRRAGLDVSAVQSSPGFERLRVEGGGEQLIVDLVAESVPAIDPPVEATVAGARIRIDTPHEILVNKLCTLLRRRELRDLADVRALLERGGDLERALADAPRKDGGFSALTVAWVLRGLSVRDAGPVAGLIPQEVEVLESFKDELVARLTRAARPE